MSIYAESVEGMKSVPQYQDDYNALGVYLDTACTQFERDLWRKEAQFAHESEYGLTGYSEVPVELERAIMERFADEEAARKERVA